MKPLKAITKHSKTIIKEKKKLVRLSQSNITPKKKKR